MQTTPRAVEVKYTCDCGRTFTSTVHHAVNVTLEPSLLYVLLAGRLNVATCPNCGRQISNGMPFVYHDMKRGLFAYVHPNGNLEQEERDEILAKLSRVYAQAVQEAEHMSPRRASGQRSVPSRRSGDDKRPLDFMEPDAPPMQVIFGMDELVQLVESLLEPEERLGHVAMHTDSQDPSARQRFAAVAGQLAEEMGCHIETQDRDRTLTVDIYGPRSRIGQLVKALHGIA